ncbi:MAG: hypothetical protein H6558_14115 [Lewinellaceae bacterium]|nr:hypothetical protein [Lewinellaceae bacterium]
MFTTIFIWEIRYWLRQPSVYAYGLILLFISCATMAAHAGIFGEQRAVPGMEVLANAPLRLQEMAGFFFKLILFLVPAIIGGCISRDFKGNVHTLLYAYPMAKKSYLLAKFFSAFCVLVIIVFSLGLGFYIGARLPGADPGLVGPFRPEAYLQLYLIYLLPNILFFGAAVFTAVALTRNIYAGFICVVLLLFVQMLAGSLLSGPDSRFAAALFDPFGQKACFYYTRYWTFAERNELLPPVEAAVIFNRFFWLGVSAVVFAAGYWRFALHHYGYYRGRRRRQEARGTEKNSGGMAVVELSGVRPGFSLRQHVRTTWRLSSFEFRYILSSRMFLSILAMGLLMVFFQQAEMNPQYGFRTLPVTWKMLNVPAFVFLGAVHLLTFLYAGMLVHRARSARCDQLVDSTPAPNWVLLFSKAIALIRMQVVLLLLIMAGGVAVQLYYGYYRLEIGLYIFQLFGLYLPGLVIWAFAALFVQTLFTNPYLGLFFLILGSMGVLGLPELGIDEYVFRFNQSPDYRYSALDKFGAGLPPWALYKAYWMLGGLALLTATLLLQARGLVFSLSERLKIAKARFRGRTACALLFFSTTFLALGFTLYYEENIAYRRINSPEEEERWKVENERRYKKYEHFTQPRITAIQLQIDLFPEKRSFRASGTYTLVNKSAQNIDTLLVHYSYDEETSYHFGRPAREVRQDTLIRFGIHRLEEPLVPGDSLKMYFELRNEPSTLLRTSSPIKYNGTFFTDEVFPGLGYRPVELTDNGKRARYGLPPRSGEKPPPEDTTARRNSYSSNDADWITFEAVVSTSEDQIALAPGYLQREWVEERRRFFHYRMDSRIKKYFGVNSGRYEVLRDKWKGVDLEIYYHKEHKFNLNPMLNGLKGALSYNTRYFSPYQHRQARIIELPLTVGAFSTTFANSIPLSELHFIADTTGGKDDGVNFPFYVAAHEMAHQWWGNQLLPADVLGAKMLTESMAEYTALRVLEKEYGRAAMLRLLKLDLDLYLRGRAEESRKERPLLYAGPRQDYINYRKGALVLYALSCHIGEQQLNAAIRAYLEKVRFQGAPYTTSLEMLKYIRKATPDSLQYLISDLFETITLYDNRVLNLEIKPLPGGRYRADVEFLVSKYRADGKGRRSFETENGGSLSFQPDPLKPPIRSLPLQDYVEIGFFGAEDINGQRREVELCLKKYKVTRIHNKVTAILDKKPAAVRLDPYLKMIDVSRK